MGERPRAPFDFETLEIGEELGSFEYVLSEEMLANYRLSVDDPEAAYPTLAAKHDSTAFNLAYDDQTGGVNAGNEVEFFNPPIPGKTIRVTGRVADKFWRRDRPYIVIEATAVDEDGRVLEKVRTYQIKRPEVVGQKWHSKSQST